MNRLQSWTDPKAGLKPQLGNQTLASVAIPVGPMHLQQIHVVSAQPTETVVHALLYLLWGDSRLFASKVGFVTAA